MKRVFLITLILSFLAPAAFAHNGMIHVMGIVTATTSTSISVKATDGTSQNVALTSTTKYLRGKNSITPTDIHVGDRVVIHATGKPEHLVAAEVKVATVK